ncbi:MAG: sigma-70 family RNA polymerase sigma factor [Acidimicrobiales bacterium]|nr:sigma-70 family RNA polymerase sigma factor [Acidimicrobiales bacterium]
MAGHDPNEAQAEFEVLYQQTFPDLLAYCRRRTAPADTEDAVADIYATAWRRVDQFASADAPLAWLYGVAYRVLGNRRRSAARSNRLEDKALSERLTIEPNTADISMARLDFAVVAAHFRALTIVEQELILLHAVEGLTYKQIADVTGLNVAAVRTRLYRLRKQLAASARDELAEVDTSQGTTASSPTIDLRDRVDRSPRIRLRGQPTRYAPRESPSP